MHSFYRTRACQLWDPALPDTSALGDIPALAVTDGRLVSPSSLLPMLSLLSLASGSIAGIAETGKKQSHQSPEEDKPDWHFILRPAVIPWIENDDLRNLALTMTNQQLTFIQYLFVITNEENTKCLYTCLCEWSERFLCFFQLIFK